MDQMWERWYPTCVALLGALVAYRFGSADMLVKENALMFVGGLGAIAIGFTTSGLTILIALEDRPIIAWLRRAPGEVYNRLLSYMLHTVVWWFLSLLLCGIALFVDVPETIGVRSLIVLALLAGSTLGGMAAWFRISRITVSLLRGDAALARRRMGPEDPPVDCKRAMPREAA